MNASHSSQPSGKSSIPGALPRRTRDRAAPDLEANPLGGKALLRKEALNWQKCCHPPDCIWRGIANGVAVEVASVEPVSRADERFARRGRSVSIPPCYLHVPPCSFPRDDFHSHLPQRDPSPTVA